MISIFELINKMSGVSRYSQKKMISSENIVEHVACVGLISYWIVDSLREIGAMDKIDWTADEEVALYRSILLHDIDEIIMGDIPRPTKYAMTDLRELIHKLEKSSTSNIIGEYALPENWFDVWDGAKTGRSGLILVASDILSVVFKCWEERAMFGNRNFDEIIEQVIEQMDRIIESMSEPLSEDFCARHEIFNDSTKDEFVPYIRDLLCDGKDVLESLTERDSCCDY